MTVPKAVKDEMLHQLGTAAFGMSYVAGNLLAYGHRPLGFAVDDEAKKLEALRSQVEELETA